MPSKTLSYIRGKYPQWDERSDEELTLAFGEAYPALLENDKGFASEYEQFKNPQGMVENFGKSLIASTIFDNAAAGFGVLETVSKPFSDEMSKWMRQLSDRSAAEGAELRETGDIAFGIGFDRGVNQNAWASKLGSGAGSLAPMLATGGIGAAAGLSMRAASVAGAVVSTLQSYGSSYQQARKGYEQQGLSAEEAASEAVKPAAAQATLDAVLMGLGGKAASKFGLTDLEKLAPTLLSKPVKQSIDSVAKAAGLKRLAGSALAEGVEEGASGFIGSYVIARHSYDPSVTLEESVREAWDSFTVGAALGGAADVVHSAIKPKSPEELAKRNTIKKYAPEVGRKLDQRDARNEVLPTGAQQNQSVPEVQLEQADRINQRRTQVQGERQKIVENARKNKKLPEWWSRYDGTGDPNDSGVPSGMRYAPQEAVDKFIEDQEAYNDISAYTVVPNENGSYDVTTRRDGKTVANFETEQEAASAARNIGLENAPKEVKKRISDYKELTRALSELDAREQRYSKTLEMSKMQANQRENPSPAPASEEQMKFVAEKLGIPAEDLRFAGLRVTSDQAEQLKYAPDTSVADFVQQVELNRTRQNEQRMREQIKLDRELEQLRADVDEARDIAQATSDRLFEDRANLQYEQRIATTPQSSLQLSELVEDLLQSDQLNPTQSIILDRLQQRKSELILSSARIEDPNQLQSVADSINQIDSNIAQVLSARIRPNPARVTVDELAQMRRIESGDVPPKQNEQSSQNTIEVGGTTITFNEDIDPSSSLHNRLTRAIKEVQKRFGSTFGLRSIQFTKLNGGAGIASASRSGVTDTIYIDRERLGRNLASGKFNFEKAIEEELLHNLDAKALRSEWVRQHSNSDTNITFKEFLTDYYTQLANSMSAKERAAARKIYGNAFIDDVHMAQEYVRQLIQKRHTGEVTEDARRNPIIRRLLETLSNMLGRLNLSGAVKKHLERIDAALLASYEAEYKDRNRIVRRERHAADTAAAAALKAEARADAMRRRNAEADSEAEMFEIDSSPAVVPMETQAAPQSEEQAKQSMEKAVADAREQATVVMTDREQQVDELMQLAFDSGKFEANIEAQLANGPIKYLEPYFKQLAEDSLRDSYFQYLIDRAQVGEDGKLIDNFSFRKVRDTAVKDALDRQSALKRGGSATKLSLDAPVGEDGSATLGDQISGKNTGRTASQSDEDFLAKLKELASDHMSAIGLTDQQWVALGMLSSGSSNKQIAEQLGVNASTVTRWFGSQSKSGIKKEGLITQQFQQYMRQHPDFAEVAFELLQERRNQDASVDDYAYASSPLVGFWSNIFSRIPDIKRGAFRLLSSKGLSNPAITIPGTVDEMVNIHQHLIERDSYIKSVMNVVGQTDRALRSAIKKNYDTYRIADESEINAALAGDKQALSKLPPDVADIVSVMRDHVDSLTKYMISKGWVSGDLLAKMQSQVGTYLARSYRIFDDKKWISKIPPAIRVDAVNLVKRNLVSKGMSHAQAEVEAHAAIEDLLAEYAGENGVSSWQNGKIGARDLSLFKKKNTDIAPEIRALMGEYTDPAVNYAKTVSRMASYIGRQQMLFDLKSDGMGKIFFEKSDTAARNAAGAHSELSGQRPSKKQVKAGNTAQPQFNPLAGLYTTEEAKAVIEDLNQIMQPVASGIWGLVLKLNQVSKASKTVYSPMTQSRNASSQIAFFINNGYLNPLKWGSLKLAMQASWSNALGSDKTFQAYYNKMTRLGLAGESSNVAELRKVMQLSNDAASNSSSILDMMDKTHAGRLKQFAKGSKKVIVDLPQTFYGMSDEIGKFAAFEMEKAKLRNLPTYAAMPEAELERFVAQRIRSTFPTYSELPPAMQRFRMQPLVGQFTAFAYETVRTQINNTRIIKTEMQNGNVAYAASRAAGMALTGGPVIGLLLKLISSMMGDVSDEEQDDFRSMLPEWDKRSSLLFWRDKSGEINYINVGFNNPYSPTADAIAGLAGLYGDQSDKGAIDAALASLSSIYGPFTDEAMVMKAYNEIRANRDQYGRPVYNEEADASSQALDITKHFARTLTPGGLDRAAHRIIPAALGKTLPSGEKPILINELSNELFGVKVKTVAYSEKLMQVGYDNAERLSNANWIFNEVAGTKGSVSADDMIEAYKDANMSRYRIFQSIRRQINAARLGGLTRADMFKAYTTSKMSQKDVQAAIAGRFLPLEISRSVLQRAREAGHPIPMEDLKRLHRKFSTYRLE